MTFDAFIAIDWSGARGAVYDGIAVACATPGEGAPRLVKPKAQRWTRSTLANWLEQGIATNARLMIGFDFAFSLTYEPGLGYLGGQAKAARDVFGLWRALEAASRGEADFGCTSIVADPKLSSLFWSGGTRPTNWVLRQRRAELACADATATRPETPFKLIGPKQVGKASLTGMRVIRHVREKMAGRVSVWPFEPATGSVLVEIYPTLFRKQAAGGLAKLRTRAELNAALRKLNSQGVGAGSYTDHDTDALISAAGMREFIRSGWTFPTVDDRIRREGWIFGVPMTNETAVAA